MTAILAIQETKRRLARAVRSLDRINAAREAMGIQADALAKQIEADRIHLAVLTGERRIHEIRPVKMIIEDES